MKSGTPEHWRDEGKIKGLTQTLEPRVPNEFLRRPRPGTESKGNGRELGRSKIASPPGTADGAPAGKTPASKTVDPLVSTFTHYLRVEKGLSNNTMLAYKQDMQRFAGFMNEQQVALKDVTRS